MLIALDCAQSAKPALKKFKKLKGCAKEQRLSWRQNRNFGTVKTSAALKAPILAHNPIPSESCFGLPFSRY